MHQFGTEQESVVSEEEMRELVKRLTMSKNAAQIPDVAEALGVPQELVRQMLSDIRTSSPTNLKTTRPVVQQPHRPESMIRMYLIFAFGIVMLLCLLANSIVHQAIAASEIHDNNFRLAPPANTLPATVAPAPAAEPTKS